jgi:hypothetical protein
VSCWEEQEYYLQLVVDKFDLKSLFASVCAEFSIPSANARGWCDINTRVDMMRRFKAWEARGKAPRIEVCQRFAAKWDTFY